MVNPNNPDEKEPTLITTDANGQTMVTFYDGTPVPPEWVAFVQPRSGGQLSSMVPDTPAMRQQYQIDPGMPKSPTGYFKVVRQNDGTYLAQVAEYTPPPAFAGTGTFADPASPTGATVQGIPRQGGKPVVLGDAPPPAGAITDAQASAQGVLKAVEAQLKQAGMIAGTSIKRNVTPQQMDQIALAESKKAGLPYQTYAELTAGAQKGPRRPEMPKKGGSAADRVRARLLGQAPTQ